jgi:hypothetical protein
MRAAAALLAPSTVNHFNCRTGTLWTFLPALIETRTATDASLCSPASVRHGDVTDADGTAAMRYSPTGRSITSAEPSRIATSLVRATSYGALGQAVESEGKIIPSNCQNFGYWYTVETVNGGVINTKSQWYPPHGSQPNSRVPSGSIFGLDVFHWYMDGVAVWDYPTRRWAGPVPATDRDRNTSLH